LIPARACWASAAVVAALAGCGGGDGEPVADEDEVTIGQSAPAKPREAAPARARTAPARRSKRPRPSRPGVPPRPRIAERPIPFGAERLEQTVAYSERHYGFRGKDLDPKVIVQHYTVIPTVDGVVSLFAKNRPDAELKELPGVCSHYLIARDGTILELVPPRLICRHTVGLNHVAIGIEHVGASDGEVLGNARQLDASLRLTAWLRCRHGIGVRDVIGHAESLSSRHHHERVARLRRQTHDDFQRASMERYRARLRRLGCG
jgi:hypothetical protein